MSETRSVSGSLVILAAILLCVSATGPARDDTNEKLARLSQRVQRIEDALGVAGRDLTGEPLARRLERIEESVAAMRVAAQQPVRERSAGAPARELASIRRAQQDMQRALDRVQRAVQSPRDDSGASRRLEKQLSGIQRSLNSLGSRVSRLERE